MLISQALTICLTGIIAICLLQLKSHRDEKTLPIPDGIRVAEKKLDQDERTRARRSVPWVPKPKSSSGFLGFRTEIKIVEDISQPEFSIQPPAVYSVVADMTTPDVTEASFAVFEDEGNGLFVPDNYDNFVYAGEEHPPLLTQPVSLLTGARPEYPLVAKNSNKEGKVVVTIFVDSTGRMAPFVYQDQQGDFRQAHVSIKSEQPDGWFFADKLVDVLPDWHFMPQVVEGQPVGCHVEITCLYCLGINCQKTRMQYRLNNTH